MKNEEKIVKMNLDDEISAAGAAGKMDNGALLHDDITWRARSHTYVTRVRVLYSRYVCRFTYKSKSVSPGYGLDWWTGLVFWTAVRTGDNQSSPEP